ncbi:MAG: secretion protein [Bacteroidetes bacterium HGW-Bacteroidetes-1]|jgi:hypothetical protein|nr:MAG: secretion protein [Bacteroidetes bacterium HGW-Bacteroidetes-1]
MKFTAFRFQIIVILLLAYGGVKVNGQYAPPAGQEGTDAIHADSSIFVAWAAECSIVRGLVQIDDPEKGYASFGEITAGTGKADLNAISLGDGGAAILQFAIPLRNGPGADFAVFENSFDDLFLELAHVEASSDGVHYERFPSVSLTQTEIQIATFGTIEAQKVNNLAGKYRGLYGVPFDLNDLPQSSDIDLNRITHIRVIDVVGTLNPINGSQDAQGHMINDPWPTPFPSSGFDLDAVGVIHNENNTGFEEFSGIIFSVFPNPFTNVITIYSDDIESSMVSLFDLNGQKIFEHQIFGQNNSIPLASLKSGIYLLKIENAESIYSFKIFKR